MRFGILVFTMTVGFYAFGFAIDDPEVRLYRSAAATFNLLEMRPIDEFVGGAQVVDLIIQASVCFRGDLGLSTRALNSLFRMSNGWDVRYQMKASSVYLHEENQYILLQYESSTQKGLHGEMKIYPCEA